MSSNQRPSVRAPVYGGRFMAVTGHAAATLAAIDVHKRGGNVIDAAIAASATLAVAVGQATSVGGDCFLLYHEACGDSARRGLEHSEHRVAGRIDDTAAVGRDVHAEHVARRVQGHDRRTLVDRHQARVPIPVGLHDGHKPVPKVGRVHAEF